MKFASDVVRHRVELAFGLALFGVNAAFALLLYLEIANGVWYYEAIYATLSIVFDAAMMLLWIRGRATRNAVFVAIAIGFAAISLFASSASALVIVERRASALVADDEALDELRANVALLDEDLAANRRAIDKTPSDFSTRLRELNALATRLRAERASAVDALATARSTQTATKRDATRMFDLVATRLHAAPASVELVFLLGTSLMLIVGSFALTAPARPKRIDITFATYGALTHVVRDGKALCGARALAPTPGPDRMCALCKARLEDRDGKAHP